jgi:hypothetical protein
MEEQHYGLGDSESWNGETSIWTERFCIKELRNSSRTGRVSFTEWRTASWNKGTVSQAGGSVLSTGRFSILK